jgi:small conductance mechanosensitive channel
MEEIKAFLTDSNLLETVTSGVINLIVAVIIFLVGKWLAKRVQSTLEALLRKRNVEDVLVDFLGTISSVMVIIVATVAALDQIGIPAASFLAIIGAAGLAIGLALKDSLSNFASGVMLVLFRPFAKDDFIEAGGVTGTVNEIHLVSTLLTTPDNKLITVPNALMFTGTITNYSAKDTRRVDMAIGVGYNDDLKVAAEVLQRICDNHPMVLKEPAAKIFINNLGDSSVDFVVRPWSKSEDYWTVLADILETAKVELEAAGCNIPYPQTDVHIHQVSAE